MICSDPTCACGITSESLAITGSGSVGDPWHIESNAFIICTSATRPSPPELWQHIFETDTFLQRAWNGSAWVVVGGRMPQVQLSQTAAVSVNNNNVAGTVVPFDLEDFDDLNWHSTSVNTDRVTPTIAGRCRMYAVVDWEAATDYTRLLIDFWKNGAVIGTPGFRWDGNEPTSLGGGRTRMLASPLIDVNGTTDFLSLRLYQTNGATAVRTARCRFGVKYERS